MESFIFLSCLSADGVTARWRYAKSWPHRGVINLALPMTEDAETRQGSDVTYPIWTVKQPRESANHPATAQQWDPDDRLRCSGIPCFAYGETSFPHFSE